MDTVTYPDQAVREVAAAFVCIRAEYGRSPDLVKEYGVKGLPDLRLLDPEGKELARLRGFTSAANLTGKCREVLDRLAGKAPATPDAAVPSPSVPVAVTPESIEAAKRKGILFLQSAADKGWPPAPNGMDPADAVLFAWATAGVLPSEEHCAKILKRVLDTPLAGTYQASFRALALARLDPKAHQDSLGACARFLLDTQCANGQWTYGPAPEGTASPAIGDNSNTAYALLGLAACRKAGIEVPWSAIEKTEAWWRKNQNPDGGWGYRSDRETESYASMTESGVSSLLLCSGLLKSRAGKDEAVERGLAWLKKHFSVSENRESPYQQGRLLYHLYALERVGTLLEVEKLVDHDWHREGSTFLLGTQKPDGSWDDGADTPIPNTCFALLFLDQATQALR